MFFFCVCVCVLDVLIIATYIPMYHCYAVDFAAQIISPLNF